MRPIVVVDGVEYMPAPTIKTTDGTLGEALRGRRKILELELEQAAELAGTSRRYMWELEHDVSMPSFAVAAKIARAYGLPLGTLAMFVLQPNARNQRRPPA